MAWWNPFKKKEQTPPPPTHEHKAAGHVPVATAPPPAAPQDGETAPELPKELADNPAAKGMMSKFYRMWKNPAFLSQLRTLAAHMAKDGVDLKDQKAVKAWLDKNMKDIEAGKFKEAPQDDKPQTFVKTGPDVGRNDPCPCGSGKKYKKCCGAKG